jgi:sulfur carrier protein ThiS
MLAGCGPRTGRIDPAALDPQQLVIDMPAIYIDFDSNGLASVGGTPVSELGKTLGQDLSAVALPPEQVAMLSAANIQHIQLNNTEKGLMILVNGQMVPSIGWDANALKATLDTVSGVNAAALPPMVQGLLPVLAKLGVGVVVRFPIAEGAQTIPLEVTGQGSAAATSKAAQDQFLASVGQPPVIKFSVDYAADGSWTVDGKSAADWSAAIPFNWAGFNLKTEQLQGVAAANIKTLTLSTNREGIFIAINGNTLPHLTWANGEIEHVLNLAVQSGALESITGQVPNVAQLLEQFKSLLPVVQTSEFTMTVNFP